MAMIKVLLLFACCIVYSQCDNCRVCIIGSTCTDDYIHFNISISNECQSPLATYFSYNTDVESEKHYLNETINCQNCDVDLSIETINDAWDYMLTLESPQSTKSCSIRKARCGGYTSRYIWIGTVSLSGLFVVLGTVLCIVRYCRTRKPTNHTI
ncbi:unnamed protein product, partial [Rotaria socialis]